MGQYLIFKPVEGVKSYSINLKTDNMRIFLPALPLFDGKPSSDDIRCSEHSGCDLD